MAFPLLKKIFLLAIILMLTSSAGVLVHATSGAPVEVPVRSNPMDGAEKTLKKFIGEGKRSELTSAELLAEAISSYEEDVTRADTRLEKLGSNFNEVMNNVLTLNSNTLILINLAAVQPKASLISYIWPLRNSHPEITAEIITANFDNTLIEVSTSFEQLIHEVQLSLHDVDIIQARLATIHEIGSRERRVLESQLRRLLETIWYKLGGDRGKKRNLEADIELLDGIGSHRAHASTHVTEVTMTLERLRAEMRDIRRRATIARLDAGKTPMEVHLLSLRSGLERLAYRQITA
ncbi:hypothetical protein BD410DRAFT_796497 [Rickenella mellea]|uniref:Uncharacterized protein n=1 Tax=Rickenella mellea TaxID=50990 RepID=A0A4Y7PL85_9AGAM|nr:hypothetical protein BD410DRAFT_796497 [Rickenella mellea]